MISTVAYQVIPYQARWPQAFADVGKPLRQALGGLALRIDHIGSTSVPGLAAKDIIDTQVTVERLAPAVEEALRAAGYARLERATIDHFPPGYPTDAGEWTKWMFKAALPAAHMHHVHVRISGRANQRYALLFRDYLRAHPAAAEAYARVKRALIAHGMDSPDAYYEVKDPVCDLIVGAAEEWAVATGWEQGASDC